MILKIGMGIGIVESFSKYWYWVLGIVKGLSKYWYWVLLMPFQNIGIGIGYC